MTPLINHHRTTALPGLWHEYANLFPMLDAPAQDALRADIQAHGVREPVIQFEGRILDGRNRYMAARDLGLDFPVAEFEGDRDAALAYVLSTNLHRRHLSESQRAAIAAKLAKEFQKQEDGGRQSAAAIERWEREREVAEITESNLPYDNKASLIEMLRAKWTRQGNLERKRDWREVYAFRSGDLLKVGVSGLAQQRLASLRVSHPDLELVSTWEGGFEDEKAVHAALSDIAIDREWFRYSEEAIARIDEIMQSRQLAAAHAPPVASAAKIMNVGVRSVERASSVLEAGVDGLSEMVTDARVSVSAAAEVAKLPKDVQAEVVAKGPNAVRSKAKEVREAKAAPAEPSASDTAPEIDKARREIARLTPDAIADEIIGLREALAEEKAKNAVLTIERDDLKEKLKEATSDDMGRALGNAQRRADAAAGRVNELLASNKRLDYRLKKAEARVAELEGTPIDMGMP